MVPLCLLMYLIWQVKRKCMILIMKGAVLKKICSKHPWDKCQAYFMHRVSTKELYIFKMIQKTNAAYLELHTFTSQQKNSQSFVHTSQRLDTCTASHMADVETKIQLVPNFVQSVPSDGSYGGCDSLP
jgi:hypothetical protein